MNRNTLLSLSIFLALIFFSATTTWAKKTYSLTAGQGTPAASGKVEVGKDKNGNTELALKVEHLAQAGVLTPPATSYIIWFQEPGGQPMSQGQLDVGKNLKGEYKTVTRLRKFNIFITAENDPLVNMPKGQVVLRGSVEGT